MPNSPPATTTTTTTATTVAAALHSHSRTDAERMPKEGRTSLPRVTCFCAAEVFIPNHHLEQTLNSTTKIDIRSPTRHTIPNRPPPGPATVV